MKRKTGIGARIVRGIFWLLGQQPLKVHYFWANIIAWVLSKVLHYRESVIYINISKAFPEKSYAEIRQLAKDYYRHMADIIVEFIWFGGSSLKRIRRQRIVDIENSDVFPDLMKDGRSVIVLNSHCGNWELIGGFEAYVYKEGSDYCFSRDNIRVVYKKLKSKLSDQLFYNNRLHPLPYFDGLIESSGLLRYFLTHKDERLIYVINNDQYPRQSATDVGTFLNLPTTAYVGTATMAHKLGMAVCYMKMKCDRRGHYTITFDVLSADASKDDPALITKNYMQHLEAEIRETPFNWLWSHKRWKNIK